MKSGSKPSLLRWVVLVVKMPNVNHWEFLPFPRGLSLVAAQKLLTVSHWSVGTFAEAPWADIQPPSHNVQLQPSPTLGTCARRDHNLLSMITPNRIPTPQWRCSRLLSWWWLLTSTQGLSWNSSHLPQTQSCYIPPTEGGTEHHLQKAELPSCSGVGKLDFFILLGASIAILTISTTIIKITHNNNQHHSKTIPRYID